MCGLIFQLRTGSQHTISSPEAPTKLETLIQARGPDGYQTVQIIIPVSHSNIHLTFSASVLALRGSSTVLQPLTDDATKSLLMWNGEAWKIHGNVITDNDTQCVFEALLKALAQCGNETLRACTVRDVLTNVTGPFAFCFYDAPAKKVYYGRDSLGRRSLVKSKMSNGDLCVASVSDANLESKWEEVATGAIYEIDLAEAGENTVLEETFVPWLPTAKVRLQNYMLLIAI